MTRRAAVVELVADFAAGELLYTLEQAARMIPMCSVNALRILLHRRPELAGRRYLPGRRRGGRRHVQEPRMLTLGEINTIREAIAGIVVK